MSALNTAFITHHLSDDLTEDQQTQTNVNGADMVKATVDDNNLHEEPEEDLTLTDYSVSKPDMQREVMAGECLWEACYTVAGKPINSNASKRKLRQNESLETELKLGDSLKAQDQQNRKKKQKGNAKEKSKKQANGKKKKLRHYLVEKANVDDRSDSCPQDDGASQHDVDQRSVVSSFICDIRECVEDVADNMIEVSAGFDCVQGERMNASNDDGVKMSDTVSQSSVVCQEHLVGLQYDNISVENSDENENILNGVGSTKAECVQSAAVDMIEFSAGLDCDQDEKITACNDDGADVLQSDSQLPLCVEDLSGLTNRNTLTENADANDVLKVDTLREEDCQEKVDLKYTDLLDCSDFRQSNSGNAVQCRISNLSEPTTAEWVSSSVEENTFACDQQNGMKLKRDRRRSLRLQEKLILPLEQENDQHVCSQPDILSAVEHKIHAENAAVQGTI